VVARALAKNPEDRYPSIAAMLRELDAPGGLGESVRFETPRSARPQPPPPRVDRGAQRAAMREKVEKAVGGAFDAVGNAIDQVSKAAPRVQGALGRAGNRASEAIGRIGQVAEARIQELQKAWAERQPRPAEPQPEPASAPRRRTVLGTAAAALVRLPVVLLTLGVKVVLLPIRILATSLAWILRNLLYLPVRIVKSVFGMTTYLVGAALFALAAIVVLELLR